MLTEEWLSSLGQSRQYFEFDRDGEPISYRHEAPGSAGYTHDFRAAEQHKRVLRNPDGTRTEIEDLFGVTGWHPHFAESVGFQTGGAQTAETTFSAGDEPVRTVFRSSRGEQVSVIEYASDKEGHIVEARHYNGAAPPAWSAKLPHEVLEAIQPLAVPGAEILRVTYRYDGEGRILEHMTYFAGQRRGRIAYAYNSQGDIERWWDDDQEPSRMEYEYDRWGNWTAKVVHRRGGLDKYRRNIAYYSDVESNTA
jgi:hypothetical protein